MDEGLQRRRNGDLDPSSGEAIRALIQDLMDQQREVIERVKTLMEN